MTPERLEEIRAKHAATTQGTWVSMYTPEATGPVRCIRDDCNSGIPCICETPDGDDCEADFAFIADAHQAVPELIAEVERLQAEGDKWRAVCVESDMLGMGFKRKLTNLLAACEPFESGTFVDDEDWQALAGAVREAKA